MEKNIEKKKTVCSWKWILVMIILACMFQAKPVKAAQMVRLSLNKTYTSYDVTGDRKRDRIRIAADKSYGYFTRIRVIINGKTLLTKQNFDMRPNSVRTRICKLDNGKTFLFLEALGDSVCEQTAALYQYNRGRLQTMINFRSLLSSTYFYKTYFDVKRVSGNTITFLAGGLAYNTGAIDWDMNYTYVNGKFSRSSTGRMATENIRWAQTKTNNYTVARRFQTYKTAGSTQKAFAPRIGERVKLTHVCVRNKVPYFRVVDSRGQIGWMKGASKSLFQKVAVGQRYYCYFKEGIVIG
nr:hypothetical protein [uncultured Blautia sp.]